VPWLRISLLVAALLVSSGYRWRCYLACVDQTGTQNDYVEQRDYCREYAQLKAPMAMREEGADDDRSRKATLVSLFSQCMGKNGWTVPDGKGETGKTAAAAAAAAPVAVKPDKTSVTRTAECAFARSSASVSSIAKLRAQACDLECAEALRVSPSAPRPPACATDVPLKFATGNEE